MNQLLSALLLVVVALQMPAPADAVESACAAVLATREVYKTSDQSLLLDALAVYTDDKTLKESAERLEIGIPEVISGDGDGWRQAKERARRGETRFRNESHAPRAY